MTINSKVATVVSFLLITVFHTVNAQDFEFDYYQGSWDDAPIMEPKTHILGNSISEKLQLLNWLYTYKVENKIASTQETVVEKPAIFYSIKKANKHLVKSVKKGITSQDVAKEKLNEMLDIALSIRYQETQVLEQTLWKIKKGESITAFYTDRVTLSK